MDGTHSTTEADMVTPMFLGVVAVLKGTEGLSEGLKDSKAASFHELSRLYGEAEAASLSHLYVYGYRIV